MSALSIKQQVEALRKLGRPQVPAHKCCVPFSSLCGRTTTRPPVTIQQMRSWSCRHCTRQSLRAPSPSPSIHRERDDDSSQAPSPSLEPEGSPRCLGATEGQEASCEKPQAGQSCQGVFTHQVSQSSHTEAVPAQQDGQEIHQALQESLSPELHKAHLLQVGLGVSARRRRSQ